ncbi:MAG: Glu/Leu/Phe/Val dehydrogenase dimerization domain-containing protein [bacterium]|nr:Glu/Leu/Phe/Val dehydrogenase dimerization domain-containing protein [bacterium]
MTLWEESQQRTRRAALLYGASDWFIEELEKSRRIEKLKIRSMTRAGEKTFYGACVHDINPYTLGITHPYKGGIRYKKYDTEDLMIDALRVLGRDMSLKFGLYRLPFGGAKACMNIDADLYTKEELKYMTQGWVLEMVGANILGPDIYVPGPDYATNEETMKWAYFFYGKLNRFLHRPYPSAVFTGKPVEFDGYPGRDDATARGGLIVYNMLAKSRVKTPTFTITGFGNVGRNAFKLLSSSEFSVSGQVVAVSDKDYGVVNEKGLDFEDLAKYYKENRGFAGYKNGDVTKPEDVITEVKSDVHISAAQESVLTKDNADKLEANIVAEFGNAAITDEAEKIFLDKGKLVIPDVFANSGGVIVSSFEWRKNRGDISHDVDLEDLKAVCHKELKEILKMGVEDVLEAKQKYKTNLRMAANIVALRRLEFLMQRKEE